MSLNLCSYTTADVQSYLVKTICQPTLCYGSECMNISNRDDAQLDSTQGQLIKRSLGLSKRSYNTELFQAMNIKRASDLVSQNACSLFRRICSVSSPARNICLYHLYRYVLSGHLSQDTLLDKVIATRQSPISPALKKSSHTECQRSENGHVDSIRILLYHENFVKPYSAEHLLVHLLTSPL